MDVDRPPPLTSRQRAALEKLDRLPDSEIDLSDIPERTVFHRPVVRKGMTVPDTSQERRHFESNAKK